MQRFAALVPVLEKAFQSELPVKEDKEIGVCLQALTLIDFSSGTAKCKATEGSQAWSIKLVMHTKSTSNSTN